MKFIHDNSTRMGCAQGNKVRFVRSLCETSEKRTHGLKEEWVMVRIVPASRMLFSGWNLECLPDSNKVWLCCIRSGCWIRSHKTWEWLAVNCNSPKARGNKSIKAFLLRSYLNYFRFSGYTGPNKVRSKAEAGCSEDAKHGREAVVDSRDTQIFRLRIKVALSVARLLGCEFDSQRTGTGGGKGGYRSQLG